MDKNITVLVKSKEQTIDVNASGAFGAAFDTDDGKVVVYLQGKFQPNITVAAYTAIGGAISEKMDEDDRIEMAKDVFAAIIKGKRPERIVKRDFDSEFGPSIAEAIKKFMEGL